jgi:hypothetical protein
MAMSGFIIGGHISGIQISKSGGASHSLLSRIGANVPRVMKTQTCNVLQFLPSIYRQYLGTIRSKCTF